MRQGSLLLLQELCRLAVKQAALPHVAFVSRSKRAEDNLDAHFLRGNNPLTQTLGSGRVHTDKGLAIHDNDAQLSIRLVGW